jgi:hypothetical protein
MSVEAVALKKQPVFGDPMLRIRRVMTIFWGEGLVLALALLLWVPRFSGSIDLRWDGSVYYVLGTSLASGDGYRIGSEPGSPRALQYPPLLPAIVALHERALGTNDPALVGPWLRISYAFIFGIYAVAVLRLAKRYLRPVLAVTATTLCLLNPFTIFLSDLLFAELPFAVISVFFALVAGGPPPRSRPWLREAASFVLAASGFLLRSAGVALLAAWVLQAVLRRRWRQAIVRGVLALLPIICWQAYVGHVQATDEYSHPAYEYQRAPYQYYNVSYLQNMLLVDPFRPELGKLTPSVLVGRLATNLSSVPSAIGQIISAKEKDWRGTVQWIQGLIFGRTLLPPSLVRLPILALATLVIVGLVVLLYRRDWVITFIVLGSVALVSITPWPGQFTRYLEPLSPFLTIAALIGLCQIVAALSARRYGKAAILMRWASAFLLLLAIVVEIHTAAWAFGERAQQPVLFTRKGSEATSKWFMYDSSWRAWEQAANWIDAHAPRNAIVATTSPHFYYLQTGRLAVLPPMESDPAQERHLLDAVPVSYVIIDNLEFLDVSRRYALPAVEGDPTAWQLVQSFDGTKVYERGPGR